ncbi:MAG: glycosyltransferase [Cellulomonadaceae bacterium]|nr:glycosyltransferase [Cellulomonadaceae bacterium]
MERLIEWTGERCVPWTVDLQVVYEHYHRYLLAAGLAGGKRILDLASGEGYGSAILAQTGSHVVGLEIDPAAVEHSRRTYELENLEFVEGTMLDLSRFPDGAFDVVTCFEALEHVVEHDELVAGVRRVLAPGGVFLTSTPDRLVYSEHLHQHNPFHVRELSLAEFDELLGAHFAHTAVWGQAVAVGSLLSPVRPTSAPAEVVALAHEGEGWVRRPEYAATYYVAAASQEPLPELPGQSVLVDVGIELVRGAQREAHALTTQVEGLRQAVAEGLEAIEAERARGAESARVSQAALNRSADELAASRANLERAMAQVDAAVALGEVLREGRDSAMAERDQVRAALETITSSRVHRLALRYYRAVERVAPAGTRRRALYGGAGRAGVRALRTIARRGAGRAGSPVSAPMSDLIPVLPMSVAPDRPGTTPLVSIVIPVHGQWPVTARCLRSFVEHPPTVPYEVVVVDDASPDDSRARLEQVPGIVVVPLDVNRGFVGAVNAGVAECRGEYVVLLNNDTEIRSGWLEALLHTGSEPGVGLVGSKLVYPDGRLQEAGGIIFADAGGWNFGRGDDPQRPMYNFRREVDYCSGAAILLRRDLLEELGGLDEYFAPAYYDDVDLAFAVRERGLGVVYEPRAVVVHHEGVSHGTDERSGVKAYQEVNRKKLQVKWAAQLAQQLPNDAANVAAAARRRYPAGLVVVIDHHVPEPDEDAGSVRMYEMLGCLRRLGYGVLFVPDNRAPGGRWGASLQAAGVEVLSGWEPLEPLLESLRDAVVAVIGARVGVAWPYLTMVRRVLPGVPFLFDTVDLHHLREERHAQLTQDPADLVRARTTRELELAFVRAADVTLVVSPIEQELLANEAPDAVVRVVPTVHERTGSSAAPAERAGLVFVGSYAHPPNADALAWFLRDVLPLIRQTRPDLPVKIVGRDAPEPLRAMADEHVEFLGWVADLAPVYAGARVTIAPLRYGAGLKGKVGEAMSHGVPVVGTSVAYEGMGIEHRVTGWVADSPAEFARGVLALLDDDVMWTEVSAAGQRHVDEMLGTAAFERCLVGALEAVGLGARGAGRGGSE